MKTIMDTNYFHLSEDGNILEFNLSSNYGFRRKHYYNNEFVKLVGELDCYSRSDLRYVYAWDTAILPPDDLNLNRHDLLNKLGLYLQQRALFLKHYLLFLWFVKDNSISMSACYGHIPAMERMFVSLSTSDTITTAKGVFKDQIFTLEELENALNIFNAYNKIAYNSTISREVLQQKLVIPTAGLYASFHTKDYDEAKNYNDFNRIERAFRFLAFARHSSFLPHKIALYIPVLECLFSTSPSEATQKVSERTAFYLGTCSDERRHVFDTISHGYNLRSRYIHGGQFDKKRDTLLENQMMTSENLDSIIRRVLTKVILNDSELFLDNEKLNTYLKYLMFF